MFIHIILVKRRTIKIANLSKESFTSAVNKCSNDAYNLQDHKPSKEIFKSHSEHASTKSTVRMNRIYICSIGSITIIICVVCV